MKTLLDHDNFNVLKARMAATIAAGLYGNEYSQGQLVPDCAVMTASKILELCEIERWPASPKKEGKE